MSSIKVDPAKLEELSAMLKKLSGTIGDREQYLFQDITQLTRQLRGDYPEREVQRALDKVDADLQAIRKMASSVTSRLTKKSDVLIQAASIYRRDEEKAKKTMKQKYIPPAPSSYYIKGGGLSGEGLKDYLNDPLFQDPVVQKLHEVALHGTEEEQTEAKKKLDEIFKARNTISRAQVAHAVYKSFGNIPLMNNAHKEAFNQREILKRYGISEDLYKEGVDLTALYKGSKLEACSYDPSFQIMKDDKIIPVLLPQDNQYLYLLGLIMEGGSKGAWAKKQLDEIHDQLKEIGRAQVAWWEYKAKNMKNEMDGAHEYAEKLRKILKDKYSLSSETVDGVDFKNLWVGVGAAGKAYIKNEKRDDLKNLRFEYSIYQHTVNSATNPGGAYKRNYEMLVSGDLKSDLPASTQKLLIDWWGKYKSIYQKIGQELNIPPELVFAIHYRECQKYFSKGTAFEYSMQDGKNKLPEGVSFEEDSIRVLKNQLKKMNFGVKLTYDSQDLAAMLVFAELYNGFGYYLKGQNSTYVFNQTTISATGKYTSDFSFDSKAKDAQPGIAAILLGVFSQSEKPGESGKIPPNTNQQATTNPKTTDLGNYKSVASREISKWTTVKNLELMPIFSQDRYLDGTTPSWYNEKLGNSKNTRIYEAGCTLTAVAMAESWKRGMVIDPSQLNKELKDKKVFSGASLIMESIPNIKFDRHMGNEALFKSKTSSAESVETLYKYAKTSIDRGNPVLIDITDSKYQLDARSGHWILAVGYDEQNKDMLVVNPAGGEVTSLKSLLKNGSAKRSKYKDWVVADYNELYSER
ncbi:C39 family peptidase [Paenibacillus vini]|uniref:C39 family peptidase n=1 Tax=Paenibacillus vini TaxID=1476024 RepID=UPI0025B6E5CE|nr:C39 family peptidase [Paenibacillus vini]MDN4068704.1 C39 family peptidase [Paenibacillus vini]